MTINAPDDWNDHSHLLETGFNRFQTARIVTRGDCIGTVEIAGGQTGCVRLIAGDSFEFAMADGEKVEFVPSGPGFVYAPVVMGADAGFVHIRIEGKTVGKIPLLYGETVETEKEEKKSFIQKLSQRN